MSLAPNLPLNEITEKAFRLLVAEMGVVNTARFLNQYSIGSGDAVAEKDALFGTMTVAELADAIRKAQPKS